MFALHGTPDLETPTVSLDADFDDDRTRAPAGVGGKPSVAAAWATLVFQQLLALGVCVGVPALVTAIAPVSWVKLERQEGRVKADAQTCLLFVVPYKTSTVDPVTGFGDRFAAGTVTRERRPGPDRETKSEDEGFLVIEGPGQSAEVSVSPVSLGGVLDKANGFLEDSQAAELRLFVVANWKFSVIGGGLISLLTVLYVAGVTLGLLMKFVGLIRWGWKVAVSALP